MGINTKIFFGIYNSSLDFNFNNASSLLTVNTLDYRQDINMLPRGPIHCLHKKINKQLEQAESIGDRAICRWLGPHIRRHFKNAAKCKGVNYSDPRLFSHFRSGRLNSNLFQVLILDP